MSVPEDQLLFHVVDYVVFAAILLVSALIGVYFGFLSKVRQNNTNEYLMGGKKMGIFPISMSLIARLVYFRDGGGGGCEFSQKIIGSLKSYRTLSIFIY